MCHICLLSIQRLPFVLPSLGTNAPPSLFPSPSPTFLISCLCLLFPALCPSGADKYPLCWELDLGDPELILFLPI